MINFIFFCDYFEKSIIKLDSYWLKHANWLKSVFNLG